MLGGAPYVLERRGAGLRVGAQRGGAPCCSAERRGSILPKNTARVKLCHYELRLSCCSIDLSYGSMVAAAAIVFFSPPIIYFFYN